MADGIRIIKNTAKALISFTNNNKPTVELSGNWTRLELSAAVKALDVAYTNYQKKLRVIGDTNARRTKQPA